MNILVYLYIITLVLSSLLIYYFESFIILTISTYYNLIKFEIITYQLCEKQLKNYFYFRRLLKQNFLKFMSFQ